MKTLVYICSCGCLYVISSFDVGTCSCGDDINIDETGLKYVEVLI